MNRYTNKCILDPTVCSLSIAHLHTVRVYKQDTVYSGTNTQNSVLGQNRALAKLYIV